MTTIVYRGGIIAADTRATISSEAGGSRLTKCEKLFRKCIGKGKTREHVIIGTAGEGFPALLFVDWYGTGKEPPSQLIDGDADFTCVVLTRHGLYEYDKYCRGEKQIGPFYACGSGAKAALGALYMGANAKRAVEIACLIDPYSAPPITTLCLPRIAK
jgi:hypothetical protein